MSRVNGEFKLTSKHVSMVTTQVEQVLKAQNELVDELNNKYDFVVRVATRTGKMTQEPILKVTLRELNKILRIII